MNSTSVNTPERRHIFAKKKTVRIPDMTELHQTQFPAMPCWTTKPVTASGVSAAKVVATIEMPASHHGTLRPERKNSPRLWPPRRAKASPMPRLTAKKPTMTATSIGERRIRAGSTARRAIRFVASQEGVPARAVKVWRPDFGGSISQTRATEK